MGKASYLECSKCHKLIGSTAFKRHYDWCDGTIPTPKKKDEHGKTEAWYSSMKTKKKSNAVLKAKELGLPPPKMSEDTKKKIKDTREINRQKRLENIQNYREYANSCRFRFSLNNYPDEFNFDLVKKYGWYRATNHGGNGEGVSRDHMISIKWGWINHISPEIISHPANCQLLMHKDNKGKGISCSLTLEQLEEKILLWNKKYEIVIMGE